MDAKGHIYLDPTEEEIKKMVEVPKGEAEALINGNRAERRKWYKEQRKKLKQQAKAAARMKDIKKDVLELKAALDSKGESGK